MGLGSRNGSRHETAHTAAVDSSQWWDFHPGQRVMTVDGYPGRVTAVQDGPHPGNEAYEVTLDSDLGGGLYTSSQLRALSGTTAAKDEDGEPVHLASADYPELGNILESRPDIAHNTVLASKTAADALYCDHCGDEIPGGLKHAVNVSELPVNIDSANKGESASLCKRCASDLAITPDTTSGPDYNKPIPFHGSKTAADWGDLDSHTACPNCDSKKASVNQDGTTSCPECGMHTAAKTAKGTCPLCGGPHATMTGGTLACPDCGHGTGDQWGSPASDIDRHFDACAHCKGAGCASCGGTGEQRIAAYDPYSLVVEAALDPEFRFHFTAAWKDVQAKAKRLRGDGQVRIVAVGHAQVAGEVKGDHHVYATSLQYVPATSRVAAWECGCKWAAYSWGRTGPWRRYEGRMCSHALALQYEAQSRGMFGQEVFEDQKAPAWLKARTRVVVEYDRDSGSNVSRPAVPRKRDMGRFHSTLTTSPMDELLAYAVRRAEVAETVVALQIAGCGTDESLRQAVAKAYHAPTNKPGNHPHGGPEVNVSADMGSYTVCSKCHGMGCATCGWDGLVNNHSAVLHDAGSASGDALQSIHPPANPLPAGHHPSTNPAQSGFLTAPDPWFGHDQRYSDTLGIDSAASLAVEAAGYRCADCGKPVTPSVGEGWKLHDLPSTSWDWEDDAGRLGDMEHDHHPGESHMRSLNSLEVESAASICPDCGGEESYFGEHADHPHLHGVPWSGCTGAMNEDGSISHDAETCPIHEKEEFAHPEELGLHEFEPSFTHTPERPGLREPERYAPHEVDLHQLRSLNMLDDVPEGALPETDGTGTDPDGEQSDMDRAASVGDIVAAFQRQATHLATEGGGSADNAEIANAAREALSKMALKDFTPAEQQALISEGSDVTARNLDGLDIAGTHYEQLEAALAAGDDDDEWMFA